MDNVTDELDGLRSSDILAGKISAEIASYRAFLSAIFAHKSQPCVMRLTLDTSEQRSGFFEVLVDFHFLNVLIFNEWKSTGPLFLSPHRQRASIFIF
jgi:hypothetical protein